jgi:hypothetical protein
VDLLEFFRYWRRVQTPESARTTIQVMPKNNQDVEKDSCKNNIMVEKKIPQAPTKI